MRALITFTAITIVFFAVQAQAQTLCSGAGIHKSCVTKPGNGSTTQANANAKTVDRWYQRPQQTGNVSHNQGTFGTQLNTARHTGQNLQATQK